MIWVDFIDWKNNGVKVLEAIWRQLNWEFPAGASQAALIVSESHKNRPESYKLISPDQIQQDLGEAYQVLLKRCSKLLN